MAESGRVTGTGTEDDPYVVNDFESFQYVIRNYNKSYYLKLGANIDCNDNGDDWEWTTLTANYQIYIDLNGKTIKNMIIKSDNQLFTGGGLKIYNGKILNVFSNSATNIFTNVTLENLSISINATTVKSYIFNVCPIKNCAIYVKSYKLLNDIFYEGTSYNIKNSDIWVDINDLNGHRIITIDTNSPSIYLLEGSRLRGKVSGNSYKYLVHDYLISAYYSSNGAIINNVIELDTSGLVYDKFMFCPVIINTVINTEKMNNLNDDVSCIRCTTAEMRNADKLNDKGFNVVKVSG